MSDVDRAPLRWGEILIISGVLVPVILAAVGWGVLYERVDNAVNAQTTLTKIVAEQGTVLSSLNVAVVKLSDAVDRLSARLDERKR